MKQRWMLDWNEAAAAGSTVVGGKGWNLGRLFRYGFQVPAGGVVSSAAYEQFMNDPRLKQRQDELLTMSADDATSAANVERLGQMQEAIRKTPLPEEVIEQLREFLLHNDLENVPLAVRSSATAEDGATASFAGIHSSRLGQVGLNAAVDGIRACYASLWTPRAVAYRRRLGLLDVDVSCAVVVCRMIGAGDDPNEEPAAAGVAFSCEPRTGRFDVVTVGAVRGLGEKLVDGSANPEELTVKVGVQFNVVERSNAPDHDADNTGDTNATVLTDEQAVRLAHIVARIQWALGDGQDPQDVEWAFDGASFWIVQARPVTGLPRHTFPGAKPLPVVWSNANLKDALPGVLSPLGWSVTLQMVRHNLFAPHMAAGYSIPLGLESMRRFSGRAYFDLTSLFWAFYDALGMSPSEFNRSLGGHQPEFSVPESNPMKGPHASRRNRARMKVLRAVLRLDKTLPAEMQIRMEQVQRQRGTDLTSLSLQQLRRRLQGEVALAYDFGMRSMLANTSAGLWHQFLEMAVAKVAPDEAAVITSDLQAGSGNVVSAEHGYRLFDLAAMAKDDAAARALLESDPVGRSMEGGPPQGGSPDDGSPPESSPQDGSPRGGSPDDASPPASSAPDGSAWRRLPEASPFRRELERFIADFGHRAVYEVDIANPRWVEDPTFILEQIRLLLETGPSGDFRAAGTQRRSEAEEAIAQRTLLWRPLIRWLARRTRHGNAMREAAKSTLVSYLEPCRYIMLELGRRMYADNVLADPKDIFYLTWIEIDAFMCSWWDGIGATALVVDRKAQRDAWHAEDPPDVIMEDDGVTRAAGIVQPSVAGATSGPAGRSAAERSDGTLERSAAKTSVPERIGPGRSAAKKSGATLHGTGVAAGTASGRVRILRHPSEGGRLNAGEILVAPSTDPGWTPLFMRAAAVVMEVGGYHSHGAIVAREFGIPAVANIPGLLSTLHDGDVITVHGDEGIIVREAE